MQTRLSKLYPVFLRLFRFGIVGVLATVTHALILWALVEFVQMRPSIATVIGFLVAFNVSYFGHYYFTFRSTEPHRRALPRFAATATAGALLNWLIFVIGTDVLAWHYWIAFGISIVAVPIFVYFVSRRVAFERKPPTGAP
nr:GtrA family protein [Hyphomonas sp. Mor2]